MEDLKYWIWLSKINLNPERLRNCLEYIAVYEIWNSNELILNNYFTTKEVSRILDNNYKKNLENHLSFIEKYKIRILTIEDDDFPKKFKDIKNMPIILYALGNIDLLKHKNIAIVGSRECTDYGKITSTAFSYLLAKNDFVITSGLAKGIDSAAHNGCMLGGGKTIAVVGTGLDIIYPKENKELMNNIIKNNGLIISEFPLGTKPCKLNFPKRNRIISGLSDGVLVIEASKKSGALITADFALEHGKDVYAVPGNITSNTSIGTNELIKDGAKMVTNIQDILEDFYY